MRTNILKKGCFYYFNFNSLLKALPPEARKLLVRDQIGVEIKDRISSNQVRSILSGGHVRPLDICVEDIFARVLLVEIIRTKNKELLKAVAIHDIGDKDAVREAVRVLRRTGKNAIAVRDADVGMAPQDGLLSFPGDKPPEVEVFSHPAVKDLITQKYDIDIDWILSRDGVKDHHKIAKHIAVEAEADEEVVRALAIERYIHEITDEFDGLVARINAAVSA